MVFIPGAVGVQALAVPGLLGPSLTIALAGVQGGVQISTVGPFKQTSSPVELHALVISLRPAVVGQVHAEPALVGLRALAISLWPAVMGRVNAEPALSGTPGLVATLEEFS